MSQEYKELIGIPESHQLVQTDSKWRQSGGKDTDTYWYDEVDEQGNVIAKYIVKDSTSMYPPQKNEVTFEKVE